MVARSRYAEDQLEAAVRNGTTQYVILGAGLDTSAYRGIAETGKLNVFEVDHPATQAWKMERLKAAAIAVPSRVQFVPVDFERQKLAEELAHSGLRDDQAVFFSWLGVVPYLTQEAAAQTFGYLGSFPPGSGIAFDYAVARAKLTLLEKLAFDAIAGRVARAGEPFRLFFEPDELAELLKRCGFRQIEQL